MLYKQAYELAATWVRIMTDDRMTINDELTIKKPYGWVFFYKSRVEEEIIVGNAPIIVDRIDGEIRVTGTARPIQSYLDDYEATLPPARLIMSLPEEP